MLLYKKYVFSKQRGGIILKIKRTYTKLTNCDMDILNILWDSPKSLTAQEITNSQEGLTINTVQAELRKLLKLELIAVADIVYSGTVLCRSYRPAITAQEFTISQFTSEIKEFAGDIPASTFVATLLDTEPDKEKRAREIEELEHLLEDYKKNLSDETK